jgi:hypothetical protein
MALSLTRRWLSAVLLLAVLAPEALPLGATRHRCACGMAVGCCCLYKAAMKAGDHCALRRPAQNCGVRPGQDRTAELLPRRDRASWTGLALRDGLRLRLAVTGAPTALDESPPDLPRPAPPTPPPRFVSVV